MNPLDIEIARFMQNAKLAYFTNATQESEPQFVYSYYKLQVDKQLSSRAKGRLAQDLSIQNIKSFSKSYRAAEKVINSALMVRYLASTLSPLERINSLAARLEKVKIKVLRQQEVTTDINLLAKAFKLGLILLSEEEQLENSGSFQLTYSLAAPALYHMMLDTIYAWGFTGDIPKFSKGEPQKIRLSTNDEDPVQREMIELGKRITESHHPNLK